MISYHVSYLHYAYQAYSSLNHTLSTLRNINDWLTIAKCMKNINPMRRCEFGAGDRDLRHHKFVRKENLDLDSMEESVG